MPNTTKLKMRVNPDADKAKRVIKALRENDGYCPCELHKTPSTKCMCKAFREQVTPGPCHCGLYVKEVLADEVHEQEDFSK